MLMVSKCCKIQASSMSDTFLTACLYGYTELVRILLENPNIDPGDKDSLGLQYACEKGHTEIVRLLLKSGKVNPMANNDYPFKIALKNHHIDIVKMLYNFPVLLPLSEYQ